MISGLLAWAARRALFILAAGVIGGVLGFALDGPGSAATGFAWGLAAGLALLAAWFALRELV